MKKPKMGPVFVSVGGWVAVWEKGARFMDVYPATVASQPGIADEMVKALREERNHADSTCTVNVSDDLTPKGSPRDYLSPTTFVKITLQEWVRDYSHLHQEVAA